MRPHRSVFIAILLTIVLSASPAFSQARDTASIYGTVTDPQGAIVPGARVALTNAATGQTRIVETDQAGGFVFPLLRVGTYSVLTELTGFQRVERTGILIQANENVRVDVVLQVGSLQETITVEALATQVESRSMTLKETVDQRRVVELPLNGRNPADLALLTPGVVSGTGNNTGDSPERGRRPRGTKQLTVNGSRNNNLRYTLDGGENMDNLSNFNLPFPFPDAVQEFSVQSATGGAELGNSSAGAVNIVTKSGTNDLHGSTFWFVRNTEFNANNFFSHRPDQLKRNQWGFTLGGPFIKNKLFAFGGYQRSWYREAAGSSQVQTLTAAERGGDFSRTPITIHDPLSGQPFPSNMIPQNRLSRAAQNILTVSPLPDPDGFTRYTFADPENGWQYIGRLDYIANDKHNLMFRYFEDDQSRPFKPSDLNNVHAIQDRSFTDTRSASVAHNYIVSPTMLARTQVTGMHVPTGRTSDFTKTFRDFGVNVVPKGTMISLSMSNSAVNIASPWTGKFGRASQEVVHDWTWSKGNHTMSWGTQINWRQYNEDIDWRASGHFTFNGFATGTGNVLGFDRADFMLGLFSFFTQNSGELENRRQFTKGFHFSDVWRMKPGLTLSLGVRYEPYAYFYDTLDRLQTFDLPSYTGGVRTGIYQNAPPGLFYPGDARPGGGGKFGRSVMASDNNNLAPRVGIAWDPFGDGKTSLRAAYGIYYDAPPLWGQNNYNLVAPFSYSVEFNEGILDDPFRGREQLNRFPQVGIPRDAPYADPLFIMVTDDKYVTSYTQSWHFTFEREVLRDTRLRLAYVGTKASQLLGEWDQNAPIYNPQLTLAQNRSNIDARRPIQDFQNIVRMFFGLNSAYNALQVSLDKRYSNGFTVLTTYTWSKTLDYVSNNGFGGGMRVGNPFNFFFERGFASQDRPHRFVSSFVWDIPGTAADSPAVVRGITKDWKVNGIVSLQSGRPFHIGATGDPMAGAGAARVDLIGTGNPVPSGLSKGEKIAAYFDTSRFQNPAPNTRGTLGRSALRGPGFSNLDAALVREFPLAFLGEAGRGQFRFEVFNVFNRTNLSLPVLGITNSSFGRITSTDGEPRILQFALRFAF